jgi:transposase InsO family protein
MRLKGKVVPLKPWMSVCVYSVFMLSCVYVVALRRPDHSSKESCLVCEKRLRNWIRSQDLTKSCRTIDEWMKGKVEPITVTSRSKPWTAFARSNAGIVGWNPTQGMGVCIVCVRSVCVVLCVHSGLVTGWSPVQVVLPTVYRIKNLKKRLRPNKGL